jgi:hypothetical protein
MIKLNEKRMINRLPKQFVYILNCDSFIPLDVRGFTTLNEKNHKNLINLKFEINFISS